MDVEALKQRACAEIDRRADALLELSHAIHAQPELGFAEHVAHDLLVDALRGEGLDTTPHAYGLATAFSATAGTRGPQVAVLCEYDALPGIGHACGHNIIAAAGFGAGVAAATLADEVGGRVLVLGTPAEEGGGGKVLLADRGALDGVDAALMVHPAGADLRRMEAIAVQQIWVTYTGRAAHAAAAPHRGRNALDGAVLGYMNIAALRQHIAPAERIHGIFTEAGEQANIVPRRAAAKWFVRSPTLAGLERLKARVLTCLQAGADAAGVELAYDWKEPVYADMVDNPVLIDRYVANAARLGRSVVEPADASTVIGSTDMGNISHLMPSIHPMIAVSPPSVPIHTEAFAAHTAAPEGDLAVLDGAKALAMTVIDCWVDPAVLVEARASFDAATAS